MEKNKPLLSICIPTYNRCEYLKTTLKKLTQDNYFLNSHNIEIVISDNCSNDGTEKLCQQYIKNYPNKIKYIRQEKEVEAGLHVLKVMNYASGKYLKLNNDTLYFEKDALSKIVDWIENEKAEDIFLLANGNARTKSSIYAVNNIDALINDMSYFITWIGAFCVKADMYKGLTEPERYAKTYLPQVDILLRLIKAGASVTICNDNLLNVLQITKKGGNYNIAEVFGKNYLGMLKEYLKTGELSKKVYEKEKKKLLLKHINHFYFDLNNQFTFQKTGYLKYLIKDYKFNLYFYIGFISNLLKKEVKHLFSIKRTETHRIMTIFGLKIKTKRKNQKTHLDPWKAVNKHNKTQLSNIENRNCVTVGNYSYGQLNILTWGSECEKLEIGNFVSISDDVKFMLSGNHPYNGFSTYPFKVLFLDAPKEAESNGPIIIKDDVWIGEGALILSGVTLGQGCIVAARSVVTKDIPPYAIVGGNPAKIIKYRFEQEIIDEMVKFDFSRFTKEQAIKVQELLYTNLTKDNVREVLATIQGKNV